MENIHTGILQRCQHGLRGGDAGGAVGLTGQNALKIQAGQVRRGQNGHHVLESRGIIAAVAHGVHRLVADHQIASGGNVNDSGRLVGQGILLLVHPDRGGGGFRGSLRWGFC